MFPLPSVLLPRAVLPLQVFERRYLEMIDLVLSGDRRFGVVLIERGSSVGGGEERFSLGTIGRVIRVGAMDNGRLGIVAVGEKRFRVVDWLPEAPYPSATVVSLADGESGPGTEALVDRARRAYRRGWRWRPSSAATPPIPSRICRRIRPPHRGSSVMLPPSSR